MSFGWLILPKNERKQFVSKLNLFVRFLGESKTRKRHFEINWPLVFDWNTENVGTLIYPPIGSLQRWRRAKFWIKRVFNSDDFTKTLRCDRTGVCLGSVTMIQNWKSHSEMKNSLVLITFSSEHKLLWQGWKRKLFIFMS